MPIQPERVGQRLRDHLLVVHDQDGAASTRRKSVRVAVAAGGLRWGDRGELDHRATPLARLALELDRAAVLVDHAAAQGQSEARTFADRLGGEEGLEDFLLDVRGHARAAVHDLEPDAVPVWLVPRRHRDPAWRRVTPHGIVRVREQVDQHLMELVLIRPQHRKVGAEIENDLDAVGLELVREQLHGAAHHLVQPDAPALGLLLARQRQEVADDPDAAIAGLEDLVGAPDHLRIRRFLAKQLGLARQGGERIVQLVRDARQERAHRRDLLALQQALGPLADGGLERAVVPLDLEVEPPARQKISHAQEDLEVLERLREEIRRAGAERAPFRLQRGVRRQDDDRHVIVVADLGSELREHGEAVDVRHHQIQHHQVGPCAAVARERLARVGRARDVGEAGAVEQPLEQPDVRRIVVHHENAGRAPVALYHGLTVAFRAAVRRAP